MSPTSLHTSKASRDRALHLFWRDLRLADHAGLTQAARYGDVVPALVYDPAADARLARNPRRAAYFTNAVASLATELRARGTHLVCRRGPLIPTVLALARDANARTVTWCARYDAASIASDRDLQGELEEAGYRVAIVHDAPAVAPEETAGFRTESGGRGYRASGPYTAAWLQASRSVVVDRVTFASHALHGDALPVVPPDTGGPASRAENIEAESSDPTRALASFERYLAAPMLNYPSARSIPAGGPTARISAALSFGVLSARTLLARVDVRARDPFLLTEEKLALAEFVRALARRDFFFQLAWFFDDEPDVALQGRMRAFPFATDHPKLDAWRRGATGYPLVDAGIRQLHATGWMHPRARLVAASFCCFDLGVDWRIGRDAWDDLLVEDDAALANGNWQWVAGVGADLAQFPRIYNPRKQARSFDSSGAYARRWIPELAHVSDAELFGAKGAQIRPQLALALYADAAYPSRVVDHDIEARAFLARYADFTTRSSRSSSQSLTSGTRTSSPFQTLTP